MSDLIDRTAEDKVESKAKRKRDKQINDIKEVTKSPAGKRFCWRILEQAGCFRSSFTGNSSTFYNEGKRSIGLWLTSELMDADPMLFARMQADNYSAEKSEEALRQKELEESK